MAYCSCGPPGTDKNWCAKHDPPEMRAGFLGLGAPAERTKGRKQAKPKGRKR
jgi:hypothetical protein